MIEWLMPVALGRASLRSGWQFVGTFIGRDDRPHALGAALCVTSWHSYLQ